MNRLKTWHPDVAYAGAKVGADEVDFYHQFVVRNPSIDATAVATAVGTRVETKALVENLSALCDYPRNLTLRVNNVSGSTNGGTATINGVDQFGNVISETFSVAAAANGGTAIGTKVFSKFTSGSVTFGGAGADAAGCTANVGYGTAGTTTLFGLPFKIGGTGDLVNYSFSAAEVVEPIKSNRLGSLVSVGQHAILAAKDFGTATGLVAWWKSTKDQSNDDTGVVGR